MKKLPKPKKVSDQVLDTLMRKYVRLISGGYCKRCKQYAGGKIEVSHLYRRRRKTVRWSLKNVYPLCPECHFEIDNDVIKAASFMHEVMTSEEIEALQFLANKTIKDYPISREEIKADLKEKIKTLEGK